MCRARRGRDGGPVISRLSGNGPIVAAPDIESLAGYFAILREWDQRLTENDPQEIPKVHEL